MSQHSTTATTTATTTTASTSTTSVAVTTIMAQESSAKSSSSAKGSLKKQKKKDMEVPITDDFVLMATPEKFKDKNVNESSVVKRYRPDSSPNEKVNLECLLLSDTSLACGVAQHVQTLLQHFESTQMTQAEILYLMAYIVALESGFIGQTHYEQAKLYVDHLSATSSFYAKNLLRLTRLKPSYSTTADKTRFSLKLLTLIDVEDVNRDNLFALLTGFVTGDFLIVTLSPANSTSAKGFSTTLSIGRYVLSMQAKNKPLYHRLRKMNELSNILRDQLFVPMRCQHLNWLEFSIYPSLDGMPVELYDHILEYLNTNQLKILANVNKSFYNLIKIRKFKQQSSGILAENTI